MRFYLFAITAGVIMTSITVGAALIIMYLPEIVTEISDPNSNALLLLVIAFVLFRIIESVIDKKRNRKPKLRRIK